MKKKYESTLIIIALWLLMFASSSQFFIMPPILPQICSQLKVEENLLGILISAYSFSLGIMALFAGYLSDKIGRRNILLIGSTLMTIFLFAHILAYNFYSILTIRILTGVAGGILTGSCISFVRDYYPYNKRGWANGVIVSGSGIGQIVGIPVGVILGESYGFATPFQIFGLVMLFALISIYFFIPRTITTIERVKIKPLLIIRGYINLLKKSTFRSLSIIYILMYFSITIFLVYYPKWIALAFNAKARDIALIFFIGGIASLVASPIAGKYSDLFGRKKVIIITNISLALTMLFGVFAKTSLIESSVLFFFAMLFISGRLVSIQSHASDITNLKNRGQVMCLMISVGQIGMGLGSGIAGFLFSEIGFEMNLIVGAAICVLLTFIIFKHTPFNLEYLIMFKNSNQR